MKIIDLGLQVNAEKLIKNYIKNLYKEQYENDLKERAIKERKILIKELVQQIINSADVETFYSLLKNGITKGIQSYKLLNHSSEGFMQIINLLADQSKDIPLKKFKILVLVTGKDKKQNVIWDASKNIKSLKCYYPLKNVLVKKEWDYLIKTLNNRGLHIYRDQKNRQGHSNDLPSYWALGFNSVYEMKENISEEEFNKYVDAHYNCCGFFKGEYTVMRRCDKKKTK